MSSTFGGGGRSDLLDFAASQMDDALKREQQEIENQYVTKGPEGKPDATVESRPDLLKDARFDATDLLTETYRRTGIALQRDDPILVVPVAVDILMQKYHESLERQMQLHRDALAELEQRHEESLIARQEDFLRQAKEIADAAIGGSVNSFVNQLLKLGSSVALGGEVVRRQKSVLSDELPKKKRFSFRKMVDRVVIAGGLLISVGLIYLFFF